MLRRKEQSTLIWFYWVLVCFVGIISFSSMQAGHAVSPERPIIGILSQTITDKLIHKFFPSSKKRSYIATSYVKFVQAGGARVVPILDTYDSKNLTRIFKSLNGLLLPGGGSSLKNSKYIKAIKKLLNLAIKENEDGGYFPVFGICLGFEAMHVFFEKKHNFLSPLDVENKSIPIKFDKSYGTSRMFFNMSKDLRKALQNMPITANFHHEGIHPSWYKKSPRLKKQFRLLATSKDRKGRPFVAAMEGIRYPFYGLQFHPEKPAYEWHPTLDISHTSEAVKVGQHFADFFVDEARKNSNRFANYDQEIQSIIDRYPPTYTAFNVNSSMPFDGIYIL